MRKAPWLLLVLVLLLGWLQYKFWFGVGSSGQVVALEQQVASQKRENAGLQERNDALAAEVEDLKLKPRCRCAQHAADDHALIARPLEPPFHRGHRRDRWQCPKNRVGCVG